MKSSVNWGFLSGVSLFILLVCICCISTRENATNKSGKTSTEDFYAFYNRFHSDSLFQKSRIKFPLKGKSIDGNGEKTWAVNNWEFMRTRIFDIDTTEYEIDYLKSAKDFTQKVWLKDSGFFSECRFELIGRKWYLVYVFDQNL